MGTEKNRLDETVLLSIQNMFKLMDKKIIAILRKLFLLNWPYGHYFVTYPIVGDLPEPSQLAYTK